MIQTHSVGVPEGGERQKGAKRLIKEIMAKIFRFEERHVPTNPRNSLSCM